MAMGPKFSEKKVDTVIGLKVNPLKKQIVVVIDPKLNSRGKIVAVIGPK